jgi:methyl-accepting chemotaxis protein
VVAAEVRKLAERSKLAATEISNASSNTLNNARNAGDELVRLVPEIDKTVHLVQEITSSSQEQAAGAVQINNAVQQLNMVTQQTASASEEIAANADSLMDMARQLKEVISFFKLKQ